MGDRIRLRGAVVAVVALLPAAASAQTKPDPAKADQARQACMKKYASMTGNMARDQKPLLVQQCVKEMLAGNAK